VAGLAAAILIVGVGGGLIWWRPSAPPTVASAAPTATAPPANAPKAAGLTVESNAVAVLPFENLSAEPDSANFTEGMHEEVRMAVSKVSSLKVIARSSVLQYADAKKRDLKEIAAKLGVASVVEGTVRRQGNRVRIAVQLVDTRTATELWGDSYEKELTDMFAVQAAIAQEVAGALKTSLTAGERATLAQQLTQNPEAYRLYLQGIAGVRGMGIPGKRDLPRIEASIDTFERAVAADPKFILPYLQLTIAYGHLFWFGDFDPSPVWAQRAEAAAERVREIAPGSPEARLAAGVVNYVCRNDWQAALADFRAAQVGQPNAADPVRWEAVALRRLGRWPEALDRFKRYMSLSPQDLNAAESLTETQLIMHRYQETVQTVDALLTRVEGTPHLLMMRALAQLAQDGDFSAYRNALAPLRAQVDGVARTYPWRADLYAGDFAAAEQYLASPLATHVGPGGVVNNPVALYRAITRQAQGDRSQAREQALEARRYFEGRKWTNRQQSLVAAELALCHALAGERALAQETLARSRELQKLRPDAFIAAEIRSVWGMVLLVLGDREGALAELREMAAGASPLALPPPYLRFDPFWSQLKDDPRFEEFIRSTKPL
jgi:TolB-like protein